MVSDMFPMLDEAEIPTLLHSNNMDVQMTINAVLGVSGTALGIIFFIFLNEK